MHRRWRFLGPHIASHQGGWDEALMIFGIPIVLFALLRWLGIRRERKEASADAGSEANGQRTGGGDG